MDNATLEKAQTAFIRARISLLTSHPFWAHLVMKLPLVWMDEVAGGLSCTDGDRMYIQPAAFLTLSKGEQVSVLVHEAAHCAAGHLFRRGSRDAFRWNVAGDVYIANMLEADRFEPVQAGEAFLLGMGLDRAGFSAMPTETIYESVPERKGTPKGRSGDGKGNGKEHWNGDGCFKEAADAGTRSEGAAKWRQAVVEAGQLAGDSPGTWNELVKAAMPKPPFHLKLFEYLNRGLGGDSTWDALNRRYLWQGLYLPCDTRMVMGRIAIAVDTSGSMSRAQFTEAFGYIRGFRDQHPCDLDLIQCDYGISEGAGYRHYPEYEVMPETFKVEGRGGTSFDPPFKLLREKRIEPKVLIYLTDGYGTCSEKRPPYSVLWIVLQGDAGFAPPFGEVVQVR